MVNTKIAISKLKWSLNILNIKTKETIVTKIINIEITYSGSLNIFEIIHIFDVNNGWLSPMFNAQMKSS